MLRIGDAGYWGRPVSKTFFMFFFGGIALLSAVVGAIALFSGDYAKAAAFYAATIITDRAYERVRDTW